MTLLAPGTAAEERPAGAGGNPMAVVSSLDEVDITSMPRYLQHGYPWADWDLLRDHAPVYWYEGRAPVLAVLGGDPLRRRPLRVQPSRAVLQRRRDPPRHRQRD